MITDEIEESIKKKQIIIKRMRFKLVTKNKLEDTFIFWQREREEREEGGEEKKYIRAQPLHHHSHTPDHREDHADMLPTLLWKTMFDHKMKREKCGASHFCF
jgi:hypothetical protein